MSAPRWNYGRAPRRAYAYAAALATFLVGLATVAADAQTEYRFERMWPTLEQPWYFSSVSGVAQAPDGSVYVGSYEFNRIAHFDVNGNLLQSWGGEGSGIGQFYGVGDIAVGPDGSVFVSDFTNQRIQRFNSDGSNPQIWFQPAWEFRPISLTVAPDGRVYVLSRITYASPECVVYRIDGMGNSTVSWGGEGSALGQFIDPHSIGVSDAGWVYVLDAGNSRVQRFDADGQNPMAWGSPGEDLGEFFDVSDMAVAPDGHVYVCNPSSRVQRFDFDGLNPAWVLLTPTITDVISVGSSFLHAYSFSTKSLHRFSLDGTRLADWSSLGTTPGHYQHVDDIATGSDGSVYVAENITSRVERFDANGRYLSTPISSGRVHEIAVSPVSPHYIYCLGVDLDIEITRFDADGTNPFSWGSFGSGVGQFNDPRGLATGPDGSVYIAESNNHRVQRFDPDGQIISLWGSQGLAPGEFYNPMAIAIGPDGLVYVLDGTRIQRFGPNGENATVLVGFSVFPPFAIAVGPDSSIFVSDFFSNRVRRFDSNGQNPVIVGDVGAAPGQFYRPWPMAIGADGSLYTVDDLPRIQKFKPLGAPSNGRAIVVAAGGPFPGNVLWDATQYAANFAYRSLAFQGFPKDRIQYLSSNTQLDLDQNGLADDVDANCTNANLQSAIQTWASGAENLVIYLVDHGGNGQFRMSESETLTASQLESWIDAVDPSISGKITIVYDSCQSGSFMSALTGANRTVITSASGSETAKFISTGTISFSNFFWEQVFNGNDVNTAFTIAQQAMAPYQSALLDADGDGITNEAADLTAVTGIVIGSGTNFNLFRPIIAGPVSIVGGTTLSSGSTATIFADNVTDPNDPGSANDNGTIARVWAVLRPPNFTPPSPDNPVMNFPTVELLPVGGNRFEGTYSGFTTAGTYNIVIYSLDNNTETSLPQLTTLNVVSPLRKKAIIAVGTDPASPEWPVAQEAALEAYETLQFQQYADSGPNEDIKFYAAMTFSAGVDGTLTSANLQFAINTWAASNTQDLVVYLIGPGNTDSFRLNSTQNLSATTLDGWLDTLQSTMPGVVTVLYDGPKSGSFRDNLLPPASKKRIFLASTNDTQAAGFVPAGAICFSRFFWRDVANGANVGQAFTTAKLAMDGALKLQVPGLDDNANGVVNEKTDGPLLARLHNLGTGIILAGDAPLIAGDTGDASIGSGTAQSFGVTDATSTGTIATVWAMIMPPGYSPAQPQRLVTADLSPAGGNDYSINYAGFTEQGDYTVAVFAEDVDGVLSLPRSIIITQPSGQFTEAPNAESLRNNFNSLNANHDGGLSWSEALVQLPGMTPALFNQLDDNHDNLLSMAELLAATVGDPGETEDVYVDFAFAGVELGTPENPFNSVTEAAAYAAAPGTLHFAPGTTAETTLLTRQATLRSNGGIVRIGEP